MQELIEFYSLFEGMEDFLPKPDDGLRENIINVYLKNYNILEKRFVYSDDKNIQNLTEFALKRLSRGDRKRLSIYKDLSQMQGKMVYKLLFDKNIIKEEISREKPFKNGKNPIKKELRNYQIDSKIHFTNESTRFWFNFIAPNKKHIQNGDFKRVLTQIDTHLDKHISLCFEVLSEDLIKDKFSNHKIESSGSYWYKRSEIDLLIRSSDGLEIVGESKWKNSKICKNILNSLQKKAKDANLHPTHFALFSKSGYSKEMLSLQSEKVLLFKLEDFKRLVDDR